MRLVFLGVVFASLAVCSLAASDWGINLGTDMPSPRVPHRVEDRLHPALNDRAGLLFRALDKDHDKFISKEDVEASQPVLNIQMPGITVDDFLSFMQAADKDKDNKLSRKELFDGLATGMDDDEQADVAPSALLESQASLKVDRRRIHEQQEEQEQDQDQDQQQDESDPSSRAEALQNVQAQLSKMRFHQIFSKRVTRLLASRGMNLNAVANKVVSFVKHKATKFLDFLSGSVKKEEGCVMCQYIVQRCEANVKLTGINNYAFLELDSSAQGTPQPKEDLQEEIPAVPLSDDSGAPVLLETQAETKTKTHGFDDQAGAAVIASAHTSTRMMRQQERVRFNEIYRVVDLTLDDVCEQGMPNTYYGYCKQIYKSQVSLVDGLRYQYRSADICFRIGMCTKKNYLAKDMHSRYKSK